MFMSNTKRTTKTDRYNQLLAVPAVAENTDLVDFINHEIELLARKNTTSDGEKKLTPTQRANIKLMNAIVPYMEDNALYLPSDIARIVPACSGMTPQKLGPLMHKLYLRGDVEELVDKNRIYYRKVAKVEEGD